MRFAPPTPFMFADKLLPDNTRLVGYAALLCALNAQAPLRRLSCVSKGYLRDNSRQQDDWKIFDRRYWPGDTIGAHLTFALKYEPLDLLVLKRIYAKADKQELEAFVRSAPTGAANRRIWFFYETLTGQNLNIPDAKPASSVNALDTKAHFTARPILSKRHRVRNNLLGDGNYCPTVRRTDKLETFLRQTLSAKAREIAGKTEKRLLSRASGLMLLADSRASFAIEGEHPPHNRLERWGRAVSQAGRHPLHMQEILRLHAILMDDTRHIHIGLRPDGVFLGDRDHHNEPLPEFIGARPRDLPHLMEGLIRADTRMRESDLDAVIQAAATSFGFVYIHPFQDGNGRIHRCLIHHILAQREFAPPGMVFPVSSVMLERIGAYQNLLRSHSAPLMEFIQWRTTEHRNVEVINDTADLYRYFDCTEAVEFLYSCIQRTLEQDLPAQLAHLHMKDKALRGIMNAVEMPERMALDFIMFVQQNGGRLPKRRRTQEFSALADAEILQLEAIVNAADHADDNPSPP